MCEGHLLNLSAGSNSTQNFISSENIFTFENNLHYGRRTLCRVLGALPSVETQALGKEAVCRVPHSAKAVFAECQTLDKEGHSANVLFVECQALGKE